MRATTPPRSSLQRMPSGGSALIFCALPASSNGYLVSFYAECTFIVLDSAFRDTEGTGHHGGGEWSAANGLPVCFSMPISPP